MMPSGPCPAQIMIVGEAPGAEEERIGRPFSGASGLELDRMLHEVGFLRSECMVTNVARIRPPHNDIKHFIIRRKVKPASGAWTQLGGYWVKPEITRGLELLHKEIELCKPKVILALGNLSLWALTGKWGVTDWRGSSLRYTRRPEIIVLPTYHPAAVLRVWSWRPYVISDLKRAASLLTDGIIEPHYSFIIAPQFEQTIFHLSKLFVEVKERPTHISLDIETRWGHIACIGLAWSDSEAICIPMLASGKPEGYWPEHQEFPIFALLRQLISHSNCLISGQNIIYDTQYLWRWLKVVPNLALDTMVTQHVLWPGTDKGLDVLSSLYCRHHVFWKNDSKEWSQKQDERLLWSYNCQDAVRTWEIAEVLVGLVAALKLEGPALFQHRMWWRALETMIDGVKMDDAAKLELSKSLGVEVKKREVWLESILGHPLNVRSPKQMKELFYDDLKLPIQVNRTAKGTTPTTNEAALRALCTREPLIRPLVRRILEIRSLGVFKSTFVDSAMDTDGRMRCSYNIAGTVTFRFSSSENAFGSGMNLQNVPGDNKDSDDDDFYMELPNVRKLFIPELGFEVADMDLSSADLRIVVEESDETEMRQLLDAGLDPYTEIAKEFYNDSTITKKDPRRDKFKRFAHGTHYLGTPKGLAQRIGLSVAECTRTQAWYFGRFRKIKDWHERLCDGLRLKHSVQNAFGYRRFYFDRIDGTLYNEAAAWIPQSTIGLVINKAWDQIRTAEPEIKVSLQVHDSLTMQYPADRAEYFRGRLRELSRVIVPYPVPLVIPTGFKFSTTSWGDCR